MDWVVELHEDFEPEFDQLTEEVQDELLAYARLLERFGPMNARMSTPLKDHRIPI